MQKKTAIPFVFKSISAFHKSLLLQGPKHPLISLINLSDIKDLSNLTSKPFSLDFYSISLKKLENGKIKYGRHYYDFAAGTMSFISPRQLTRVEIKDVNLPDGQLLLIHPDFISGSNLGNNIQSYGFFSYEIKEALHLSENEKKNILDVFDRINEELHQMIDDFSQNVILSYLEVLFNYSKRFYKRQFITRKVVNHDLLTKMDKLLNDQFETAYTLKNGLPTVESVAAQLFLSPRYLSDMLRSLTGLNAQQHIHQILVGKAKEKLSGTELTISEIAYQLGFGHPQSFSKLFKIKTGQSPLDFRRAIN